MKVFPQLCRLQWSGPSGPLSPGRKGPSWESERKDNFESSRLRKQSQDQGPWCLQLLFATKNLCCCCPRVAPQAKPSQQRLRSRTWRQMPSKGTVWWMGWDLSHHPNSAYSSFPALNFFAGLSIAIPWESLFPFFLSLKIFCDPFGPGDLQHHKPPMLFGEAGLAVAAACVCIKPCWQCCATGTG